MDKAREVAEGKLMVDAAKKVGVKLFVWSFTPSVTGASNGAITTVSHFDSKAETFSTPRPAGDGSYFIASTWRPESRMPLIDTYHDAGLFVRLAIESEEFNKGDGGVISAYSEWVSSADQAAVLGKAVGKKVAYMQVTDQQMRGGMEQEGMPQHVINDMLGMFRYHDEFWEKTYIHSNREQLARAPRTYKAYCEAEDWDGVFA
ncbi:hypothetical protein LTR01_009066 [Friedmanniomyces endolithicus]|nr:hypothetical protein LTR01_009066 [Friedmanniomyces endolithicus]